MKSSVKIFIVVVACTMTTELLAQTFGIKAGLNLSNLLLKDDDDTYSDDFKMRVGFHAGVTADIPLAEVISFETGLLLSTRGFRVDEEETIFGETFKSEGEMNLLYLDIPLTAKVSVDLGGARIYGVLGPYLGIGLSGNFESKVTVDSITLIDEDLDIEWGSDEDEDDLKRLDMGLIIGAGIEISAIQLGLTYGLGLANISPYTDEGTTIRNRVLGLSLAYRFGSR